MYSKLLLITCQRNSLNSEYLFELFYLVSLNIIYNTHDSAVLFNIHS